jgi:hypothetical protein
VRQEDGVYLGGREMPQRVCHHSWGAAQKELASMHAQGTTLSRFQKLRSDVFALFGSACQRCGYSRCRRALHFHHLDGSEKKDWSGKRGNASPAEIRAHPERFILLCANCHAEEHERLIEARREYWPCLVCGAPLLDVPARRATGHGRYCSRACEVAHRPIRARTADNHARRFWRFVTKGDGCWQWSGYLHKQGFGTFQLDMDDGRRVTTVAPRFSYELHIGAVPDGHYVLQSCGNRACVNPAHLYLQRRGRMPRAGWATPPQT